MNGDENKTEYGSLSSEKSRYFF